MACFLPGAERLTFDARDCRRFITPENRKRRQPVSSTPAQVVANHVFSLEQCNHLQVLMHFIEGLHLKKYRVVHSLR